MIEIFNEQNKFVIVDSSKKRIELNKETKEVTLDGFDVTYPWEYEKSGILLEVKEYEEKLFIIF